MAVAIATIVNWFANFTVGLTFPYILVRGGRRGEGGRKGGGERREGGRGEEGGGGEGSMCASWLHGHTDR